MRSFYSLNCLTSMYNLDITAQCYVISRHSTRLNLKSKTYLINYFLYQWFQFRSPVQNTSFKIMKISSNLAALWLLRQVFWGLISHRQGHDNHLSKIDIRLLNIWKDMAIALLRLNLDLTSETKTIHWRHTGVMMPQIIVNCFSTVCSNYY